jgi:hypothetical protein
MALIPAGMVILVYLIRTHLEARVQYRLIPWIW